MRAIFVLFRAIEMKFPAYRINNYIQDDGKIEAQGKNEKRDSVQAELEKTFDDFQKLRTARKWWIMFLGFHSDDPAPDCWYNTAIGAIQFLAYPMLFYAEFYQGLGAWLVFKTFAVWRIWSHQRQAVNRIILGNALEIAIAFGLYLQFFCG